MAVVKWIPTTCYIALEVDKHGQWLRDWVSQVVLDQISTSY